jgi:indolepyruvate ferredoxin oxidoreductase
MFLDTEYRIESRYRRSIDATAGRVFISGQQALVRLLLAQAAADRVAGIKTAGFVSGYRGSPLGGLDQELWQAKALLAESDIRFQPAINEDLAATTLIGTQRVEVDAARRYDGVFGMWYGKGPGVDRSGDALKHGNAYGSSPHGGVLVVTGDDHGCVSSSMSHQSDRTLMAWGLPVIHPAGLADYERCGLWGWALSRCSGLWVGFKAITDVVEASASIETAAPARFTFPPVDGGPDGLHWRWPDLPGMQIERRFPYKLEAARAFIRANPLDIAVTAPERPRLVIGAVGKAYHDVREVLARGGVGLGELEHAGVALLKINLVYPLSPVLEAWARRADTVLMIEEKAPVVEDLLKQQLFNAPLEERAAVIGKTDEQGDALLSSHEEIRPSRIATVLRAQLAIAGVGLKLPADWLEPSVKRAAEWVKRTPYLCSGCPHNTSTRIPEGSEARLGIGCHAMAARMPDRATSGSVQMGGEGVDWLGQAAFVKTPHIFQNIGDGTFFHSGYLAIRQAIAAGVNITYKVLYNDAVAMTGGQPVDGKLTVRQVAELVKSEGAREVVVVADEPARYRKAGSLLDGVALYHRDELDAVQRRLRELNGVSVLIFDQVCATEARRRRKHQPPARLQKRVVINEQVCEGCGDCQAKSNCLSVVPVETEFGRKRSVDTHSCNTDLSCIKGYCPSFVTATGAPREKRRPVPAASSALERAAMLPMPESTFSDRPFEILLTGVGGTGVVTVAATIGLAAHLEGRAVSVLDFTGFAQKGGSVLSHIRIAKGGFALHQHRIDKAGADVLIAADLVVASEDDAFATLRQGGTTVIASTSQTQTGAMLHNPDLAIEADAIEQRIRSWVGEQQYHSIDAGRLAAALVAPMQSNMVLLGHAWQRGAVPVSLAALGMAMNLQGADPEANRAAFAWGRLSAGDPAFVAQQLGETVSAAAADQALPFEPLPSSTETIERTVEVRSQFLTQYQDARYAARYCRMVEQVRAASAALADTTLAQAVAGNLFKLMAFKDEYEVARLYTSGTFLKSLREQFADRPKLTFHLAPPILERFLRKGSAQQPAKIAVSGWIIPVLRVLAGLRFLRQTPLDPFGWLQERRAERRLIVDYEETLLALLPKLSRETLPLFVALASIPESIRGYGHIKSRSIEAARSRQDSLVERIAGRNGRTVIPIHATTAVRVEEIA